MIYFAHRGASAQHVQNTLPAFALAQKQGASCYELDVHLTRDGIPVVHHDYSLLNTAGREEEISTLSRAELFRIPLINKFDKQWVFVPELAEVLPVIREGLSVLNIELKNEGNRYPGLEEITYRLLEEQFPEILPKVLFSSFDYETLLRLRTLRSQARIGLLTRAFNPEQALCLQAESVHLNYSRFSGEVARVCHEKGLKVYLYTVNDTALATSLQAKGADGFFTDRVDLFL